MKKQRKTNVKIITDLMGRKSIFADKNFGILTELFVVEAVRKWAEVISQVENPNELDNPLFSGKSWVEVAKYIREKLDLEYKQ